MELQINEKFFESYSMAEGIMNNGESSMVMITPPVGKADYWLFRVQLDGNAIIGFPKFLTIGIGFEEESDWNTNLPYHCDAERIYNHIKHNTGNELITKEDCLEAITLIQLAAIEFMKANKNER